MFRELSQAVWFFGLVAVAAVFLLLRSHFSAEARLARRRRKNYGHTISKGKGPMIKLAAHAQKPRD